MTAAHFFFKARLDAAHRRQASNAVLAFFIAYIFTRPLGASIGDYLAQAPGDGGLGLGTVVTSAIFLSAILALVAYLTVTKCDTIPVEPDESESTKSFADIGR